MAHLNLARLENGRPEIFRSIQGEGRSAGRVRTFVRLSGCNLHCRWCDTAYTWNWRGSPWPHDRDAPGAPHKFAPDQEMIKLSVEETAEAIRALPAEGIVVTGGEPMMQARAILDLAETLRAPTPEFALEMETNGTIAPNPALAAAFDLFMVSPKLAHSGNDEAVALKPDALAAFAALDHAHFKFVARGESDLREIEGIARRFSIPAARISVMPEGATIAALDARAPLVDAVIAAGWSWSDRLHIRLFGAKRGI